MLMAVLAVSAALAMTLFAVPVILRERSWLTRALDLTFLLPGSFPVSC